MGKTVAIVNQKGGVGKTTTTVNLAACIAKAGKKVLLIDMDPQANATSGVGVDKDSCPAGIYECLIDDTPLKDIVTKTPYENLFIAPSHVALTGAEVEFVSMDKREFKLKQQISAIKKNFDFILIDCPPSLGFLTLNALTAANSVLIPIQAEYYALEGVSQLTQTINLIKDSLNPKLTIEGVLLTMCDYRTNLTTQVSKEVRGFFAAKVYKNFIPRNIKLGEAPSFGKPIVYYDLRSVGAESYLAVTEEFLNNNK